MRPYVAACSLISILVTSPALAATGLTESIYHNILPNTDWSVGFFPTDGSLEAELAYVESVTPDETFINTATTFSYSGDDTTATNTYLGSDAAGAAASDTTPFYDSAVVATGTITVSTPGLYTISIPQADDAESVYIGGVLVAEADFNDANLNVASSNTVSLSGPASFELFNYNTTNGAATSLSITGPGTVGFSPTVVPEPAAWGLMLVGFGALGARMRARRGVPALAA
jgi:hypothetical protein